MTEPTRTLEREPDVVLFNVRDEILNLVVQGVHKGLKRLPSRIVRPDWDGLGIALYKRKAYSELHHPLILVDANSDTAAGGGDRAENFVLHLKNVVCGNIIDQDSDRQPLVIVLSNEPRPRIYKLLGLEEMLKAEPLLFDNDNENSDSLSQKLNEIWRNFLHPKPIGGFRERLFEYFDKNIAKAITGGV